MCCDDHLHCCPHDTICNLAAATCDDPSGSAVTSWLSKAPAFPLLTVNSKCDKSTSCPGKSTCCKTEGGDWACCPLPQVNWSGGTGRDSGLVFKNPFPGVCLINLENLDDDCESHIETWLFFPWCGVFHSPPSVYNKCVELLTLSVASHQIYPGLGPLACWALQWLKWSGTKWKLTVSLWDFRFYYVPVVLQWAEEIR